MARSDVLESEPLLRTEDVDNMPVFPTIHMIRTVACLTLRPDTPLSYEALTAPDLTYALIRPLSDKYIHLQQAGNMSIVFCLLLNRVHFLRDEGVLTSGLSRTRASLCEILAIRCLREYGDNVLNLVAVATTAWPVYSGADPDVIAKAQSEYNEDLEDHVGNAIEMAIISKAKRFLKSTPSEKVIDAIWSGKCVYQAASSHSFLSDTYKRNPVHFYNPHTAPILDHYRLKVPAIRSVLEYMNFIILFVLFIICIEFNESTRLNTYEIIFMIYALGFSLEKVAAMQEHGIRVYFTGTWNGFDVAFVTLYFCYTFLSFYGIYGHHHNLRALGIDCLALIAILLFPRLAFVTLKNNLMVLSLRAMISQFFTLMLIAIFCFGGFLYALWTFSRNGAGYSARRDQIAWWMADLWFGLDASGFDRASRFNPIFGPVVMVTYACLSNTLLLTVLVSILSHTFSTITEDAAAEAMFRRAVSTIEGVKADSLFSYQPPINVFALCILYPCGYILSPRWFHKVNVFLIRVTNLPILVLVSLYERQAMRVGATGLGETLTITMELIIEKMPRQIKRMVPTFVEGMVGSGSDIDIIFEIDEEHNSALDTHDGPPLTRTASFQPNNGRSNSSPANGASTSPTFQPQPSTSKPGSHSQPSQPNFLAAIPGRHRLTSLLHEGAEVARQAASPLAQIFTPVTVPEEPAPPVPASVPVPTAENAALDVSYGPASRRRRLSSVSGATRWPSEHQHSTAFRRFPTGGSAASVSASAAVALSESPGELRPLPKPLEETEERLESVGNVELDRRLEQIEKRQKRIEEMLEEIAAALK
ncbi:hypothetical protein K488DRAFT_45428 [Vararia minispora EC-137]|uniref:Uncharacterized protein n=1 Tax=Vararia minispora EC-137 TaxID=1314806 RepID=A0ACB8QSY2_9AGAM|nr:hypothetical protein K488DRAFT_45428 [Vararia minispora EC-137]